MSEPGTANDWVQFWQKNQKSLFQAWAEGKMPAFPGLKPQDAAKGGDAGGGGAKPAAGGPDAMGELMKRSMEEWATFAQEAWTQSGRFEPDMLAKAFDPAEWRRAGSRFDMGLEKLTEGPTFATLFDLDRKVLNAQKLWIDRTRDIEHYYEVVQGAWTRAYERFMKSIGEKDAAPIKSGRELLDLWLATANTALVEMHRSKEFLDAQRRMTRSSTDYRLAEQGIAEAFCEMHHIPTRTEMDEMQRSVTELKRELRALRRGGAEAAAAAKPPPRKPAKKRRKE
jgi:polyhydroxyalkanoate synthesis regulator phasin